MGIKINDLVTRHSYNHDVIFQVVDVIDNKYYLKGINYRLFADAEINDLSRYEKPIELKLPHIQIKNNVAPGKILHIDGDLAYMKKAEEAYAKYKVPAHCFYLDEKQHPSAVLSLLKQDKYDVLVITGHDFMRLDNKQKADTLTSYQNSYNFVSAVQQARRVYPDLDSLVIVAGACQSNYEALILNGANFASSPTRQNIHLLDPIIVAVIIATSSVKEYVSPENVICQTISKALGGIETKGKARIHYAGVNKNGYS